MLFFPQSDLKLEDRFERIDGHLESIGTAFWYPAISAAVWITIYPWLTETVNWFWGSAKGWGLRLRQSQVINREEHYAQIANLIARVQQANERAARAESDAKGAAQRLSELREDQDRLRSGRTDAEEKADDAIYRLSEEQKKRGLLKSQFKELQKKATVPAKSVDNEQPVTQLADEASSDELYRVILSELQQRESKSMLLTDLGNELANQFEGLKYSRLGAKNLTKFLDSFPDLEVHQTDQGGIARVIPEQPNPE